MNVTFTGRHIEVTDALRAYATEKLERLCRHYDKITSIHVIFDIEKLIQRAEATIHVPHGGIIHAQADSQDMYNSIDDLFDKLERQVAKHRQKENGE
ncbi:MAG: Ribosome hibernation promoting factor [Legionellaceae bacterium]